jgi:hypothetical protein
VGALKVLCDSKFWGKKNVASKQLLLLALLTWSGTSGQGPRLRPSLPFCGDFLRTYGFFESTLRFKANAEITDMQAPPG